MESNEGHNDIYVEFEYTFENEEELGEVLKSLLTSGALECAHHEYKDDGIETQTSRHTKIRTIPAPLTTEVGEIKALSTVLEKALNNILEMLEDGTCVNSVLTTTIITFKTHLIDVARFPDPNFPIAMKIQNPAPRTWWQVLHHAAHDIRPTDGQNRRLRSLHAAYLTLMFTLVAEHLFGHENTLEAHALDRPELHSSLLLAIKTFDSNWLRLKHDCRVSGQPTIPKGPQTERPEQKVGAPDVWCAIV